MIRDFWVKNYLSIRDKQELSFLAKGPSSELVTEVAEGVFLYKLESYMVPMPLENLIC